jgi:hypothetical protein
MACGTIHTPKEAAWPSFCKLYDCVWKNGFNSTSTELLRNTEQNYKQTDSYITSLQLAEQHQHNKLQVHVCI